MRVTKFPQSCLVIQKNGGRILIDPGTLASAEFSVKDFGKIDAVIYTHSHGDHLDESIVDELITTGATLYGNADVAGVIGGDKVEVIDDGDELVIAGFKVKAYHMEHCLMVDGSKAVPNTGFLFDDYLLVPGDSTEDVGIKASVLALPVFGPDISFHDAFDLVKATGAVAAVPIHYDVVGMPTDGVKRFSRYFPGGHLKVEVLANGESTDI